jgi:acyl carrier protein
MDGKPETRMTDPRILRNRLAEYIAGEILRDPERVVLRDEPLITSGLIDSFHLVDLALFVEDHFGVRIEDSELSADRFDTIEQLAVIILHKNAEKRR